MTNGTKGHRGALILVLGILSIVMCQVLGPFAWVMGNNDLREMDSGAMDPEGRGLTQAGKVCGIVGSVFLILAVVWVVFVMFLGIGSFAFAEM